jgi:formylglycine-generating enzyme required for sulfatase activity
VTFRRVTKPAWADSVGRDRFGLWSEIAVARSDGESVIQRLRWISPGQFLMGSPEDEPGRYDSEGPQHLVTLREGYWLFDTPCTQALWEVLLGENPSRFRDPERPVENVRWDDVQERFLPALNERVPGFGLPSDAQWEYACRAGTETALYTGKIENLGKFNAPALDPIAWYGGNSGVAFDLKDGEDTSDRPEKQYPHERAGTRRLKLKQPNPWGLYDMLGNVWEWVEDPWHQSYLGAPNDGNAWGSDEPGVWRTTIRGGSWNDLARACRSACRNRVGPGKRNASIGFRCAQIHG